MRPILFILIALLAGCETSTYWYATHPEKQTVVIDGTEIYVVPRTATQFDAWGGDDGVKTNAVVMKARQVRAIEIASKCKVTAAEYLAGGVRLQAVVACS